MRWKGRMLTRSRAPFNCTIGVHSEVLVSMGRSMAPESHISLALSQSEGMRKCISLLKKEVLLGHSCFDSYLHQKTEREATNECPYCENCDQNTA